MSKWILTVSVFGLGAAMVATPASAAGADDDTAMVSKALLSGDYINAEAQIAQQGLKNDPAMLINLGSAYAGMGRRADAQLAYKAALEADAQYLETADGTVRSSHQIAADGLRFLGVSFAGR